MRAGLQKQVELATTRDGFALPNALRSATLLIRFLRAHQWSKNFLLFLPAVLGHHLFDARRWGLAVTAFLCFSVCASAGYIINDLFDLPADRKHPEKRHRPLASGEIPPVLACALVPLLLTLGFALSWALLPSPFTFLMAGYTVTTVLYSLYLNKIPIVDIVTLASFYTLRLFAGGAATQVRVSPWLLAFSLFFFISLAFLKRVAELRRVGLKHRNRAGYVHSDLSLLTASGIASGHLSILVMALYLTSHDVARLYAHPDRLWGVCFFLFFWICRTWFVAHRGQVHTDPVLYAIKDPISFVIVLLVGVSLWVAA